MYTDMSPQEQERERERVIKLINSKGFYVNDLITIEAFEVKTKVSIENGVRTAKFMGQSTVIHENWRIAIIPSSIAEKNDSDPKVLVVNPNDSTDFVSISLSKLIELNPR